MGGDGTLGMKGELGLLLGRWMLAEVKEGEGALNVSNGEVGLEP